MIRNAWHISGGTGLAANSANRRVLVTRADGSQSVEEIQHDLGLKSDDKAGMMARLKAQGVNAASLSTFDGGDDNNQKTGFGQRPVARVRTSAVNRSTNPLLGAGEKGAYNRDSTLRSQQPVSNIFFN
jgi:hypothetical protein